MDKSVPSSKSQNQDENLLEILVSDGLISAAQAELVKQDSQNTGISLDEILIARGWVKEKALEQYNRSQTKVKTTVPATELGYEDHLKKYRFILADILGESSE